MASWTAPSSAASPTPTTRSRPRWRCPVVRRLLERLDPAAVVRGGRPRLRRRCVAPRAAGGASPTSPPWESTPRCTPTRGARRGARRRRPAGLGRGGCRDLGGRGRPPAFDAVICVGASHAFGGAERHPRALRSHRPGGRALIGDATWERQPAAGGRSRPSVPGPATSRPSPARAHARRAGFEVGYAPRQQRRGVGRLRVVVDRLPRLLGAARGRSRRTRAQALEAARSHRRDWVEGYRGELGSSPRCSTTPAPAQAASAVPVTRRRRDTIRWSHGQGLPAVDMLRRSPPTAVVTDIDCSPSDFTRGTSPRGTPASNGPPTTPHPRRSPAPGTVNARRSQGGPTGMTPTPATQAGRRGRDPPVVVLRCAGRRRTARGRRRLPGPRAARASSSWPRLPSP